MPTPNTHLTREPFLPAICHFPPTALCLSDRNVRRVRLVRPLQARIGVIGGGVFDSGRALRAGTYMMTLTPVVVFVLRHKFDLLLPLTTVPTFVHAFERLDLSVHFYR